MDNNKTRGEQLKQELFIKWKNIAKEKSDEFIKEADEFCEGYKDFLNSCKTERETVDYAVKIADELGFVPFEWGRKYSAGDRVYLVNRSKALILAVIGKKDISEGVRIIASHIDSPRLDLKPSPLYEDNELALFKTHYYGGIKKYQWTAIPLALHGVVVKKDGTAVNINIGEKPDEPVFCITDLLPHLSAEQMKRTLSEGIKGEELNILAGSRPYKDDKVSQAVKLNILKIINEKYDIKEEDFLSAEIEAVPAFKACDIGFDRSLIGAYGQDDRVSAYPALLAGFNCGMPDYTSVVVLADKEEVGSEGNTGLDSDFLSYFISDLGAGYNTPAGHIFSNSQCLSADVNVAFDPTFPEVLEKTNAAYINRGVTVTKYTGSRGKSGTSDASAEFMAKIRKLLDENDIIWQSGQLGKVDLGGGGTVAKFIAGLNVDVVDVGVPLLSMHSPFEIASKLDIYMAYKAFLSFFTADKI